MSGVTEVSLMPVLATCLVAAATDLARGRIYNWLTGLSTLAALVCAGVYSGWSGLGWAFAGAALGLLLYGWMFLQGFMGGGDVKLLMALGAWGGPAFAADVALVSIFVGGAMAVVMLFYRGKLANTVHKLWRFLFTAGIRELELEIPSVDRSMTMPYGVPIAAAAVWVIWANPLLAWGLRTW